MKQRRRFVALAGSAAAAIAIAVTCGVMFVSSGRVQAAQILQSFRESLANGFRISFSNVVGENVRADGEVTVTFSHPVDEDTEGELPVQSFYLDARLAGVPQSEMDGLDVQVRVADGEGNSWAYLRTDSLPASLLEQEPLLGYFQTLARNGILVDLTDLQTSASSSNGGVSIQTSASATISCSGNGSNGPAPITNPGDPVSVSSNVTVRAIGAEDAGIDTQALETAIRDLVTRQLADGDANTLKTQAAQDEIRALVEQSLGGKAESMEVHVIGDGADDAGEIPAEAREALEKAKLESGSNRPTVVVKSAAGDATSPEMQKLIQDAIAGKAGSGVQVKTIVAGSAKAEQLDEAGPPENIRKQVESMKKSHHGGIQVAVAAGDKNGDVRPQLQIGANLPTSLKLNQDSPEKATPFEQLISDVVSGKARGEEIGKLVSLLNIAPDDATLTQADGTYILTATNLGKAFSDDAQEQVELNKMVLRIAYRQDTGLQWAELGNVGDAGGKVRFEQITSPVSADLFDKKHVIEPGKTMVIDGGKLGSMFGLGGLLNADSDAN